MHDGLPVILRHSDLTLDVYFRSHDFAGAYPANVYGLFGLLEMVADKLYARPKEICIFSASAMSMTGTGRYGPGSWVRKELPPQCVQAGLSLANLREAIA